MVYLQVVCDRRLQGHDGHAPDARTRPPARLRAGIVLVLVVVLPFQIASAAMVRLLRPAHYHPSLLETAVEKRSNGNAVAMLLAGIDPEAVNAAAGLVRNPRTATENTPHDLDALSPGEWEGHEMAGPSAPRASRAEDELRHVPEHGGDGVAFLPLDDARLSRSLDELVTRRVAFLTHYQNAAYAGRYSQLVDKVRAAEQPRSPGSTDFGEAVARYFFKLMACKDEY